MCILIIGKCSFLRFSLGMVGFLLTWHGNQVIENVMHLHES
jgi:hypothetical protein